MASLAADARTADLSALAIELRNRHRLLDTALGLQMWHVRILLGDDEVGTLRAARCLYYHADNLAERLADEGAFLATVAGQLLTPDGNFSHAYEEAVDLPGSILVLDRLSLRTPLSDLVVTVIVAEIIDRLTENGFTIALPGRNSVEDRGDELLARAGAALAAVTLSEKVQLIDTALAAPEEAAAHARARLHDAARHGATDPLDGDDDDWVDTEGNDLLTPRTAAVLRLAGEELADLAWQEVAALGDESLSRGAGGVFGSLPPITLHRDGQWRRRMARAFDDLVADLREPREAEVEPRCTGEEMALHLMIARAEAITRNRPRTVGELVAGLPRHVEDYDWSMCSSVLFQDGDVLMLFDAALDGLEAEDSGIGQVMGMVNLHPDDWFAPFSPDGARDPERGFRH